MGIWDAVCSTADTLKACLPDPQPVKDAGRAACSTIASSTPDLIKAPVEGIVKSSLDQSRSAFCAVAAQAGRVQGIHRAVTDSLPDKEGWKRIGWNLTDLTLDKYSRSYTGGLPVYKIIMDGLAPKNDCANVKSATSAASAKAHNKKLEQQLQEMQSRLEMLEAMLLAKGGPPNMTKHQKPGDVIRIFTMKGSTWGSNVLCHLMVHQHENWKREPTQHVKTILDTDVDHAI